MKYRPSKNVAIQNSVKLFKCKNDFHSQGQGLTLFPCIANNLHQNLYCVCVHFMFVLTANHPSFKVHSSILQQTDLILFAMYLFNGSFL